MSDELTHIQEAIQACQRCALAGFPIQGPPIFSGPADARLMVIGQAPGRVEVNATHKPFSGSAGKRLFRWFKQAGWEETDFRARFYMTSVTKCFPGPNKSGRGDRAPTRREQALCEEWLLAELTLVAPEVVVPVGKLAIERFFGRGRRLAEIIGGRYQIDGRIVIPLPHPSGASVWIQKRAHQALIHRALGHLAAVRRELGL
ncbi:MAG TPA: uracil-DNA glycosylase [Anaerolineae bacterium]|nr:uracil-DNA glycosylase [Caldilineae bacterium]HID34009.1 uracil-DNA glycosylase [Anaerolineae bacterium]